MSWCEFVPKNINDEPMRESDIQPRCLGCGVPLTSDDDDLEFCLDCQDEFYDLEDDDFEEDEDDDLSGGFYDV